MSVSASTSVRFREFNGFEDPALPAGWWWGETTVTGDATGGPLTARVDFSVPPEGQFFGNFLNLEQWGIQRAVDFDSLIRMRTQNLDVYGTDPRWQGSLGNFGTIQVEAGGMRLVEGPLHPLFLGRQRFRSVTTFLAIDMINVLNAIVTFQAQGYFWTSRSAQALGGPQRPPGAIYGL